MLVFTLLLLCIKRNSVYFVIKCKRQHDHIPSNLKGNQNKFILVWDHGKQVQKIKQNVNIFFLILYCFLIFLKINDILVCWIIMNLAVTKFIKMWQWTYLVKFYLIILFIVSLLLILHYPNERSLHFFFLSNIQVFKKR